MLFNNNNNKKKNYYQLQNNYNNDSRLCKWAYIYIIVIIAVTRLRR